MEALKCNLGKKDQLIKSGNEIQCATEIMKAQDSLSAMTDTFLTSFPVISFIFSASQK